MRSRKFMNFILGAPSFVWRSTADDLFEDGIIYYGSDCMKHRSYLLFTITPDNYTYEVVYF